MSDQSHDAGGYLPPGSIPMTLHPDECLVGPEDPYTCIRPDHDDHLANHGQVLSLDGNYPASRFAKGDRDD